MSVPDRPRKVKQLDGSRYAGLNCTCAAGAMAGDRHTLGRVQVDGATIRRLTGDTSGGTTLRQVADVLHEEYGIDLDIEYRLPFDAYEQRIRSGRGAILQGLAAVTRGTRWQASETFGGNHAWFVNEVRADNDELVYDPLADGRRPGIDEMPSWIPRSVVREFAGKLDISDPDEPYRPLGLGLVYAAFTRDTEPHVHLRAGARRTDPFPDRTRADARRVAVYAEPKLGAPVRRYLDRDDLFTAWQQTDAWLGNHNGTGWVRKRYMRRIGGDT